MSDSPYDVVPYPGFAYTQTHPDRLATLARLHGLDSPPITTCRVLEVGCGDGANLIPMALGLGCAQFRGFDLAMKPVERAKNLVAELGLGNITFQQLDILEAPDRIGEFDYIIAHGFYSWVPTSARDKLMTICRASLAPNGVAFISYNTMPGGHIQRMVREMMLFHVFNAPDAHTKVEQTRALLAFLGKLAGETDEFGALLKKELNRATTYSDGYLFHDNLAPINDPCYLYEFLDHAGRYNLRFLGDLNSSFVHPGTREPDVVQALEALDDITVREQYLDFARCRRFRQTLLCHENIQPKLNVDIERLETMFVSSSATPANDEPNIRSDEEEEFIGQRGASMKTGYPLLKSAMIVLRSEWPRRVSFIELVERVANLLEITVEAVPRSVLARGIFEAFTMRVLDLHIFAPRLSNYPGERPKTSSLARLQAQNGSLVTNLIHATTKVEGEDRRKILQMLDGSMDREAIVRETGLTLEIVKYHLEGLARLALLQ